MENSRGKGRLKNTKYKKYIKAKVESGRLRLLLSREAIDNTDHNKLQAGTCDDKLTGDQYLSILAIQQGVDTEMENFT